MAGVAVGVGGFHRAEDGIDDNASRGVGGKA